MFYHNQYCTHCRVPVEIQSPKSADFWPIGRITIQIKLLIQTFMYQIKENWWADVNRMARLHQCGDDLVKFKAEVCRVWKILGQDKARCRRYMESIPSRFLKCIEKNGT